jgi:hypothetical protein
MSKKITLKTLLVTTRTWRGSGKEMRRYFAKRGEKPANIRAEHHPVVFCSAGQREKYYERTKTNFNTFLIPHSSMARTEKRMI